MYQLSCPISHIRCTKKVWKPTMTQLKYLFYFVYLLDMIRILKLQLLDYNYMYIHNNLHNPLFLVTVLTYKLVILTILFLQCKVLGRLYLIQIAVTR